MKFTHCLRTPLVILMALLLCACIGSPLSGGSTAGLYTWGADDMPIATRQGMMADNKFNGDYYFGDLYRKQPELIGNINSPWLLEACDEERCYSMVLFGSDFFLNKKNQIYGPASLTALSTLMANEVRKLPAAEVRDALDRLTSLISQNGSSTYVDFIRLDLRRDQEQRGELLYRSLYANAETLLAENPHATISELMEPATQSTADLVVSRSFDFDSSWELQVDIDLRNVMEGTVHVLLCKDFVAGDSGYTVNYDSCPLRTPLNSGVWQGDVTLTGTTEQILAVIFRVSEPNNPQYQLWSREVDGDVLVIN